MECKTVILADNCDPSVSESFFRAACPSRLSPLIVESRAHSLVMYEQCARVVRVQARAELVSHAALVGGKLSALGKYAARLRAADWAAAARAARASHALLAVRILLYPTFVIRA
jgi:hypothetical protein